MKQIVKRPVRSVRNAWGGYVQQQETVYEVEPSDVGRTRDHFAGFKNASYTFRQADVGRQVIVYSFANGWTNWVFMLSPIPADSQG